MSGTVIWLFGRGLSIGCGLTWDIPKDWGVLSRPNKMDRIKIDLTQAMHACNNVDSIFDFLTHLASNTKSGHRHLFATTNWDYLLQQEIWKLGLKVMPPWLANSQVFHINGTIETVENDINRSPFILPEDLAGQRVWSHESESFLNKMIWEKRFVVVGMAFECEADKFLFRALGRVEDDLPIGESFWTIINPDQNILDLTKSLIQMNLPNAKVDCFAGTLDQWRVCGMPRLY